MKSDEFVRSTDQFRKELLAHCYRMLGSVHDAEDLVQETYLRAWRSYGTYDGRRASMRTWLYRIATNACLTALEQRGRRALPSGLTEPSADPEPAPRRSDVSWLEPLPDALVSGGDDPAVVVASRAGLRLALVTAFQYLPPRQRAVLILRDVLGWRAAEVAALLETSPAAVNSALQRARALLDEVAPAADELAEPADATRRALLDRYAAAFENADIRALADLLTEDIESQMPPSPSWYRGRAALLRILTGLCGGFDHPGSVRMLPTAANGQPGFAMYRRDAEGVLRPHVIQVLTLRGEQVSKLVAFTDHDLFALFGLPETLPAAAVRA